MKITQEKIHPINRWHQSLEKKDLNILYDLLADDFQFYSPVVFKPKDKHMGFIYLIAASETFLHADDFHYEKEIINENSACLEFKCTMDGREVNGVDMFEWNSDNKFTEMKVFSKNNWRIRCVAKRNGKKFRQS